MEKYNNLMIKISKKYNIVKGEEETYENFKARIIYSVCGMMAYASLWDNWDSLEDSISIIHLKKRIRNIFYSYKELYPEINESFKIESNELEEEITNQFLNIGVVYHSQYRVAPAMKKEAAFGGILFQRGIALDNISRVSGIGFYSLYDNKINSDNIKTMFCLEQEDLQTLWQKTISNISWNSNPSLKNNIKYLKLKPSFNNGYWENTPDKTGKISLLRVSKKYYLYRYINNILEISKLPKWQVENFNYRSLTCAILHNYKTLPPIKYKEDGEIVHIYMEYLLPPRELEFLKFYSWPEEYTKLPCDFNRKLSKEVFIAIKTILSNIGYEFEKI